MLKPAFLQDFVDIIYPSACLGCRQPLVANENILCSYCLTDLPKTNYHSIAENEVLRIFTGRCRVERAASYLFFSKGGIAQSLLHQFKYKGNKEVGTFLGRMMGIDLLHKPFLEGVDFLVPVPLHPKKLKKRGYNQSEILAKGLSEITKIPVSADNLLRTVHSETQTKKSRFARWQNVEAIFSVEEPARFESRHLLLIDDVVTTGSTLEACVARLAAIPGAQVSILTLALAK